MASTAPISPRRESKVTPEPRKTAQFETEAPSAKQNESTPQTRADSQTDTEETAPQVTVAPDHEAIARMAYGYWLDRRDSGSGSAEEDWLRAERELRNR